MAERKTRGSLLEYPYEEQTMTFQRAGSYASRSAGHCPGPAEERPGPGLFIQIAHGGLASAVREQGTVRLRAGRYETLAVPEPPICSCKP